MNFETFFRTATGKNPYPYQGRLACGDSYDPANPTTQTTGTPCQSRLIDIPTGLGKTAAVTLAWLWNRFIPSQISNLNSEITDPATWPRRLVYCLPMRTLVEQTRDNVAAWLANLTTACPDNAELAWLKEHSPIILMGGEELDPTQRDWDIHPEKPAILIGTQDMLLSRALNRGYGMSRYRWPMHFGLLNNDCLWVMDEVQLMGPGLAASTQLEGFRHDPTLGSFACHSWWMSATLSPAWLATVDFPKNLTNQEPIQLGDEKNAPPVKNLRAAPKSLAKATPDASDEKSVAKCVLDHRSTEGLNLVVVNTVRRAHSLHAAISKALPKSAAAPILLHSQFRPDDRLRVLAAIHSAAPGTIVVSTQVIEAGVDLSAHKLFTELAPWSSLVQRFGRCNRWLKSDGQPHFPDAHIFWFDLNPETNAAPYDPAQLLAAREILTNLRSASLENIESIPPTDADRPRFRHVIRRKDLIELFDTTPDLAGADLDIDRFIRDADHSHVSVFWRDWSSRTPNGEDASPQPAPHRKELCSTGIAELKSLLGKQGTAWRWNFLDREWQPCREQHILPGQTYLLHTSHGGYDAGNSHQLPLGWTGDPKASAPPLAPTANFLAPPANDDDTNSQFAAWQTIAQHTNEVCAELERVLAAIHDELASFSPRIPNLHDALRHAARWHDWGKAHPAFQANLRPETLAAAAVPGPAAKAPPSAWRSPRLPAKPEPEDSRRRHFRHELASALGVLHPHSGFPLDPGPARDLAAYLVAAHHGKVRLSLRSLPGEWIPPLDHTHPTERRFARGVWDSDTLPACDLGTNTQAQHITLSLEPMELGLCETEPFTGQPSWAERALTLRDTLGPFALALLETLLRAADARASAFPTTSPSSGCNP